MNEHKYYKSKAIDEIKKTVPKKILIVPEDFIPLRHAKTRTRFREHMLRRVHDCHNVLGIELAVVPRVELPLELLLVLH